MHELGIMAEVVRVVERTMEENQLVKVSKVVMAVGEMTSVLPKYAKECFPIAAYKSKIEGAELEIKVKPAMAVCEDCKKIHRIQKAYGPCPYCHSEHTKIISGKELQVVEIVAC